MTTATYGHNYGKEKGFTLQGSVLVTQSMLLYEISRY